MHSVLMEYMGQAILLAAPSGTGKSTHSDIWSDSGLAHIINGDRTLCKKIGDQWTAFGIPWCGSSNICENKGFPISAVIVLEQHDINEIVRLEPLDALVRLLPNIEDPFWIPELYSKMLDCIDGIISELPIYLLRCRPDIDAVMTLKREMDRLLDEGGRV